MRRITMNQPSTVRPPAMAALAGACLSLVAHGCANGTPDLPDLSDTPSGSFLAVASSNFTSGALHTVDLATMAVRKNIDVIDAQPVVRAFGSKLYVLDQSHGALRTYDIARDFVAPSDSPLGKMPEVPAAQADPYDIYVDAQRSVAYVSLYGSLFGTAVTGKTAIGIVDLTNPGAGIVRFIALPVASGDSDNNPEATRLVGCGNTLLVLLQDLDRNNSYVPVGPGRLATIDLTAPTTSPKVGIIQLAGQNPTALTVLPGCTDAIVGSAGDQLNGTLSGLSGVERVDLTNRVTRGLSVKDSDLGGNVTTLDAIDARAVFIAVSVAVVSKSGMTTYNNDIYLVDSVGGTHSQKLLGPINFIPGIHVYANRLAVLAAGTPQSGQLPAGLYLGPTSGVPLPTVPLDLGLPPVSIDAYTR